MKHDDILDKHTTFSTGRRQTGTSLLCSLYQFKPLSQVTERGRRFAQDSYTMWEVLETAQT